MNVAIPCPCPPKGTGEPRHVSDTVTLRETLDYHAATTIRKAIVFLKTEDPDVSVAEILASMSELYLLFGIEAWSLTDEKGKPLDVSKPAIRGLLVHTDAAMVLTDAADELYTATVLLPLLRPALASSPPSPTEPSTSARSNGHPTPLRPSKRSSTSTSQTAGTGSTTGSLAGDSSSSPSLASAR